MISASRTDALVLLPKLFKLFQIIKVLLYKQEVKGKLGGLGEPNRVRDATDDQESSGPIRKRFRRDACAFLQS